MSLKLVPGSCAPYVGIAAVLQTPDFEFSPNPADDFINISANGHYDITITAMDGRVVQRYATAENGKLRINTRDITAGMYLLRAAAGNEAVLYRRLQVMH
jgi:hypothetical protein